MRRKAITPPQCQWMPVPNGYGVRLYSSAADVADTVRGAQQEVDRLHRRLWEKRKECVMLKLDWLIECADDAVDSAFNVFLAKRRLDRLRKRWYRVYNMECKP